MNDLQPWDWADDLKRPIPPPEYLGLYAYLPAGPSLVLASGSAGSAKSIWALTRAAALSRQRVLTTYFSNENPRRVELQRLKKLRANPRYLRIFHMTPLDLRVRADVDTIRDAVGKLRADLDPDKTLIVFDTLSEFWTGDENDNGDFARLHRDALRPLAEEFEACVLVLDHVGHPDPRTGPRRGVHAGRGASAKGQKVDTVLNFRTVPGVARRVVIEHAKNREGGGDLDPVRTFDIMDAGDPGDVRIEFQEFHAGSPDDRRAMAEAVLDVEVRAKVRSKPGKAKSEYPALVGRGRTAVFDSITRLVDAGQVEVRTGERNALHVWPVADPPEPDGPPVPGVPSSTRAVPGTGPQQYRAAPSSGAGTAVLLDSAGSPVPNGGGHR